jgi:hypothetical protein
MNVLAKERFINWKKFLLFFALLLALLISYLFISGLFELLFRFDVNAPDLVGRGDCVEQERQSMIYSRLNIHEYMYTVTCMTQVAPLITFAFSIFFFQEKIAIFSQKYVRGQSQKRVILSSLFSHSFYVAVGFYAVYMAYLIIGWCTMSIEPSQVPLDVFDGILGSNFAANHLFLYFTLCGFYKAFMAAFIYSLLSCSICLVVRKAYHPILYSSIYYYGFTLLLSVIPLNRDVFHSIQPGMIQGFTEYVYDPIFVFAAIAPLLTLVIPFAIAVGIVIYTLKRSEKVEN